MSKKLEEYLSLIPEQYRNNLTINGKFCGNRSSISFKFLCGCETTQLLKAFLKLKRFDYCYYCLHKFADKFKCKYCTTEFISKTMFEQCEYKCKKKYENLELGKDYVICSICGLHAKSLGIHISQIHNIDVKEYKKTNNIICENSSNTYKKSIEENGNWLQKAIEQGVDLTEYWSKVSKGVKESILSNPDEIKRRSELMATINKTDHMKKKASETAKLTSARPDILEKRSEQLKKWRDDHREDFHNKCTIPMINSFQSKPEKILFNNLSKLENFNFKQNQFIKSKIFTSSSNKRQIDIIDIGNRVYVEFDGMVHFKPIYGEEMLLKTKIREKEVENVILSNNWTLIRVSYDQFVYSTKKINKIKQDASYFKPECLQKIAEILKENKPGVYKIGNAY